MTEVFAGLDIGLSGARVSLVTRTGKLMGTGRIAAKTDCLSATEIFTLGCMALRKMVRKHPSHEIACLAVACVGPSPVLVDRKGNEVKRIRLFESDVLPEEDDDLAMRVCAVKKAHPKVFARTTSVLDLTGFLVSKLTGLSVMDEGTAADYEAVLKLFALPPVSKKSSASIAGQLDAVVAKRLGMAAGTPVAVGCYDSTADIAAAGFGAKRPAVIVLGSTLVMGRLTTRRIKDKSLRSVMHLGEGWFSGGWTNMAGASIQLVESWLGKRGKASNGPVPLILPYFAGERAPLWNPAATGAFLGLTPATTAADIRRGAVEAVALSALDIADRLVSELGPARRWTVIGGGTQNTELMQTLSDALGARIDSVVHAADAIGPAILAARAAGRKITLPVAKSWHPRRGTTLYYARRLDALRCCQAALSPFFSRFRSSTRHAKRGGSIAC